MKTNKEFIWWKHGVIYQIYPRSFMDSDADGIGDLGGITSKLDYLESLGIDAIWLSPIYPSPMKDFGYDISDYRSIDPTFGTDADFDLLVKEAGRRNIKIIMDMVFNHTSDQHPWFKESRSSADNPKRNWYIWRKTEGKKFPNNWMAMFGGRAWEGDGAANEFYLHSFLKEQPDLNWRNPEVLKEMLETMEYWINRGVAGFRFDVINFFVKDEYFRSNPYAISARPRPYDLQKHIYDRDRPEMREILRSIRKTSDEMGEIMTVGEIAVQGNGDPRLAASYLGRNDELHLAFDFSLIAAPWRARGWYKLISLYMDSCAKAGGWPCHVLSNHDQSRSVSRFGGGERGLARARAAAVLLLTMKGTPFLYYGEEIGMSDGRVSRIEMRDPVGIKYWPLHPGRDPERTPMQWAPIPAAGFSSVRPWLPVNSNFTEINVRQQDNDPASLLNLHRRLIALRKKTRALCAGEWVPFIKGDHGIIAYFRFKGKQKILVIVNFDNAERYIDIPRIEKYRVLLSAAEGDENMSVEGKVRIRANGAMVLEKM